MWIFETYKMQQMTQLDLPVLAIELIMTKSVGGQT